MTIQGDNDLVNSLKKPNKVSTKQRILENAIHLFASKGFTETSIRELSAACGIKEASIYNYFSSKNAILEYILDEYALQISYFDLDRLSILKENPTVDGIEACLKLTFPEDKVIYYMEELFVILQEQHRNPLVREFMCEKFIVRSEIAFEAIINILVELKVLRSDTDADFWKKLHSSLLYTFSSRLLLGIGDSEPGYSGIGMTELIRRKCEIMLEVCGVKQ